MQVSYATYICRTLLDFLDYVYLLNCINKAICETYQKYLTKLSKHELKKKLVNFDKNL